MAAARSGGGGVNRFPLIMASRPPGPTCQVANPQVVDAGTLARCQMPAPATGGSTPPGQGLRPLDEALAALQAQALNFAQQHLQDARARASYVSRIGDMSRQIRADVIAGRATAAEGARMAHAMRNVIMDETRAITSAIGRARAEAMKSTGQTLEQALDKAVDKLYPGRSLAQLTAAERRAVFLEIIEASGRSRPAVTAQMGRWTRLGRGLLVVTAAISIVNIWAAENRARQAVREGATLGGGALGAAAASASAGFVCGPAAPGCVLALFIIGGVAGALTMGAAADYVLDETELLQWLGP